jgi:hypothetical protein
MTTQSGSFYRIVFADNLHNVLAPVRNPEGRFHHHDQQALYTSCTPEGERAALGYYAKPDDAPRLIVELNVTGTDLFELRDASACAALSINCNDATVRWQNERAASKPASPWRIVTLYAKPARTVCTTLPAPGLTSFTWCCFAGIPWVVQLCGRSGHQNPAA